MAAVSITSVQHFAHVGNNVGLLGDEYHKKRSLAPLVSSMIGVRCERMEQAHLVLGARLPSYKPEHLLKDLQERHALVRTWGIRGFLQLVPTPEFEIFLGAATAAPRWKRFLEGKTKLSPQARLRLLKRLCPEVISRDALRDAFPDSSMRLFILREAAQGGHIIWKEGDGASARFSWTEKTLDRKVEPERDYHPLVRRFLAAYGPVTAGDVGSWLGVTVAAARQLMAKHRVIEIQVDGDEAPSFMCAEDLELLQARRKKAGKGFVVIPPKDPFMLAYKLRWRENPDDEPGLIFEDGRLVGRWYMQRNEVTLKMIEPEFEKKASKSIESLLSRAGIEASFATS
ncbi:MAG: hypothetical protein HKN21_00620 [Candidatus Eisenbacteria bacterium]|uniref:Winged helix DNA-binding domain-containing protein n=1 Tax=Eiseniibacteriota bacterium TaxID=2212470 RepID=A0A7Y2E6G3_UNCEI|nr:hypothetical protein [Candidatus Eisenbacteria bacterium]